MKEKKMKPYQRRVVNEKKALELKRDRLSTFIAGSFFPQLPADEQFRLLLQDDAMSMYSDILAERILHFNPKE
jgi:hypothetical protein